MFLVMRLELFQCQVIFYFTWDIIAGKCRENTSSFLCHYLAALFNVVFGTVTFYEVLANSGDNKTALRPPRSFKNCFSQDRQITVTPKHGRYQNRLNYHQLYKLSSLRRVLFVSL